MANYVPGKLRVQRRQCSTCIFRPDSSLNIVDLLNAVREPAPPNWPKGEPWDFFKGYRICHHSEDAVCAGFWARCKDKFALGQIAQRLNMVEIVEDDTLNEKGNDMGSKSFLKGQQRKARQRGEPIVRNGVTLQRGVPPRYVDISDEEMLRRIRLSKEQQLREAIAIANGRLEPKQHSLPLATTWSQPSTAAKPLPAQPATSRAQPSQPRAPVRPAAIDLPIQIPESDLKAAIEAAAAAGRATMTLEELSHALLTGPNRVSWTGQRGFLRGRS